MFLRLVTLATLTLKSADQAAKGFKDNVNHYNKTEKGGVLLHCLSFLRTRPRSRKLKEVLEIGCK